MRPPAVSPPVQNILPPLASVPAVPSVPVGEAAPELPLELPAETPVAEVATELPQADVPAPPAEVESPPADTPPVLESPEVAAPANPDFTPTNASKPLPNPLGVLGGLIALALAGGCAAVISYNNANLGQARIASARAQFFGTRA